VFDHEIAKENSVHGTGIVIFKHFDNKRDDYDGDLNDMYAIINFVNKKSVSTVLFLDDYTVNKIYKEK